MGGTGKVTTTRGETAVRVGGTVIPQRFSLRYKANDGEPDYEVTWEVRKGVPVCTAVTFTAKPRGPKGVRTSDLQALNLRSLLWHALGQQAAPAEVVDGDDLPLFLPDVSPREIWRMFRDVDEVQVAARRGPTDEELQRVAQIYRDNLEGAPVRAVEVELALTPRTAARRVQQARDAGYLPRTSPGKRKA